MVRASSTRGVILLYRAEKCPIRSIPAPASRAVLAASVEVECPVVRARSFLEASKVAS